LKIRYRAPKIGDSYVVRRNDWLSRIAQWKYGDSTLWKQLYQKNRGRIEDPRSFSRATC